jgi:hypothetical protein
VSLLQPSQHLGFLWLAQILAKLRKISLHLRKNEKLNGKVIFKNSTISTISPFSFKGLIQSMRARIADAALMTGTDLALVEDMPTTNHDDGWVDVDEHEGFDAEMGATDVVALDMDFSKSQQSTLHRTTLITLIIV